MCSGRRGLRRRRAGPVPGRRRRGAPRSGEHALLDGAGGDGGAGQVVQVARESIVAQPPAPREPPPHRGLTFGTRTAFSPRRRRGDPSSLEDNAVLDRKVSPRWRRRRRQHDGQRASGEELRLHSAPGKAGGGEGARSVSPQSRPPPVSHAAHAASARRVLALRGAHRAIRASDDITPTDGAAGLT